MNTSELSDSRALVIHLPNSVFLPFRIPWHTSPDFRSGCCLPIRKTLSDHMYPAGDFSFNKENYMKPVHESDKSLDSSMFQ